MATTTGMPEFDEHVAYEPLVGTGRRGDQIFSGMASGSGTSVILTAVLPQIGRLGMIVHYILHYI